MLALVASTLLLSSLLMALHLPLRARADDLGRAARTAPELRLRPQLAVVASRGSLAMLVAAFAPIAGALCGLADADLASAALGVIALASLTLAPMLLALSSLATPAGLRTRWAKVGLFALLVLAFGLGLCTFTFLLQL